MMFTKHLLLALTRFTTEKQSETASTWKTAHKNDNHKDLRNAAAAEEMKNNINHKTPKLTTSKRSIWSNGQTISDSKTVHNNTDPSHGLE